MSNIICAKCGEIAGWRPRKGDKMADATHDSCGGQLVNRYSKGICGVCRKERVRTRVMGKPFTIYNRDKIYPAGTVMCEYHHPKTETFIVGYEFTDGTIRVDDMPKKKIRKPKESRPKESRPKETPPPETEGFIKRPIKYRAWNKKTHEMIEVRFMRWSNSRLSGTDYLDFMEFTGLTDRDGIEIYQEDIFETATQPKPFPVTIDDCHGHRFMLGESQLCKADAIYGKVIGNTYQNPELLTERGVNSKNKPV